MEQDHIQTASEWHARIESGGDCDWAGFTEWLEADPANRAAYDKVALLSAEISAHRNELRGLVPANDQEAAPRTRRWWPAAGLAAAAIAGLLLAPRLLTPSEPASTAYATAAGEQRTVTLRDGSTLHMDERTRLTVSDGDARQVALVSGAALFSVKHDPSRPFIVQSGDYRIRDIGTRFEVASSQGRFSVAVTEGEVALSNSSAPGSQPVKAGQRADIAGRGAPVKLRQISPSGVASWRSGRLVYDNAPLFIVAADISRYAPMAVTVDPAIANRKFSGVLTIGDGTHLVESLRRFVDIDTERSDTGIRLVARPAH